MLWKCCTQYGSKFGKFSNGHRIGKGQFSFQSKERQSQRMLISHASKIMLKILQARFQQCLNCEPPDVQAGFRKVSGTSHQIANICWIIEKARNFQKNISFWFIDYAKGFVWTTTNCGKFLKRWEYQTIWPASWEFCMQVKKQQLELDMEQQTSSKLGKHPPYLT